VPKPLYPEVKAYIEDLLNRNFIKKSPSLYSSPAVCVRKKDQSLKLRVDFRTLTVTRYFEYKKCWTTSVETAGFLSLIRGRPMSRLHESKQPTFDGFYHSMGP